MFRDSHKMESRGPELSFFFKKRPCWVTRIIHLKIVCGVYYLLGHVANSVPVLRSTGFFITIYYPACILPCLYFPLARIGWFSLYKLACNSQWFTAQSLPYLQFLNKRCCKLPLVTQMGCCALYQYKSLSDLTDPLLSHSTHQELNKLCSTVQ